MSDIDHIWRISVKNNSELQIHGLLLYKKNQFIQVLEGEKKDIKKILQKIKKDKRHSEFKILGSEPIDHIHFKHWNMGYILETPQTRHILGQYFPESYAPDTLTFERAVRLLKEIANQHGVVLDIKTPLRTSD
ncbi:BLUF domain-containing protein [Legionella hackeliae]|uniref:BLUF domain-containing protein n=1 Tax=Legionella hackeliae TaxID=449 RepID=A0A0A8UM32_LEGHA|nr:BLUF domain-containing protein [Legionella hackeliae]KTD10437.1 Sensors of blue-light using FAD [Legionella hackeliae]CEK09935.1 protein of unknown function [Legionella hackeliae]STX49853.1 Sensors of blue-light using FAD [Legionella hackeliae]